MSNSVAAAVADGVKEIADNITHSIRFETRALTEGRKMSSVSDPVFEAYVSKYNWLVDTMKELYATADKWMSAIDALAEAQNAISTVFMNRLSKCEDDFLLAEGMRYREGTHAIGNRNAPHSYYARLQRDLDFNLVRPLMQHIIHAERIKRLMEERTKRKIDWELNEAAINKHIENQKCKNSEYEADVKFDSKYKELIDRREASQKNLYDYDAPLWEWLMVYNEFSWDIFDSCLQTFKYLQFDFFSGCSHHLNLLLPERMEFRPLVEMVPEPQMHSVVRMYLESERNEYRNWQPDATKKLLSAWEEDGRWANDVVEEEEYDPIDLQNLIINHKFSKQLSKFALQRKGNLQEALQYLLSGKATTDLMKPHKHISKIVERVRIPDTQDVGQRLDQHSDRAKKIHHEFIFFRLLQSMQNFENCIKNWMLNLSPKMMSRIVMNLTMKIKEKVPE
eukprot:GHVL01037800.1.p1 GENE.GHVL01037800.1~~GHVL01037800.1.p1  ORF type:complete len:450 (+),score=65.71 GHVL01037800.1:33-1382(+)